MGRGLNLAFYFAGSIMDDLEKWLADLPDGPEWSLKAEMLASKEDSRIANGVISQLLCTAVQIMVVELLQRAGIRFGAVVAHSFGEITCAYVYGFLSARDTIRVAFYHGKYTPLAKGGSMIDAGTDMQNAINLCSLPKLKDRAQLAASNSSASVTISGDSDAIELMEIVMQDESKFARKLKVDTAYHSFHMRVCSGLCVESLDKCGIQIQEPAPDVCPWYSSSRRVMRGSLWAWYPVPKSIYWRSNMLQSVLFSQALKAAVTASGAPGVVIEVGPHPALKGPASLTIGDIAGSSVPYSGTFIRGQNDVLALATTLGSIWTILGASAIDLQSFQRAFVKDATFEISKLLPTYAWDHDRIVWNEARISKANRFPSNAKHELLGVRGSFRPWLVGKLSSPSANLRTMSCQRGQNGPTTLSTRTWNSSTSLSQSLGMDTPACFRL